MYTESNCLASDLRIDDRFKMGGLMYRISDHAFSMRGAMIIWAYPLDNPTDSIRLEVPSGTTFKIYNLKK